MDGTSVVCSNGTKNSVAENADDCNPDDTITSSLSTPKYTGRIALSICFCFNFTTHH